MKNQLHLSFTGCPSALKPRSHLSANRCGCTRTHTLPAIRMVAVEREPSTSSPSTEKLSVARVGVLGAGGYTGAELLRLLSGHPLAEITVLAGSERSAGKEMKDIYGQFAIGEFGHKLPRLVNLSSIQHWDDIVDILFCCLPHGTTQEIIRNIMSMNKKVKIIDLSADFRLTNINTYEEWYNKKHEARELQKQAIYGLTEIGRNQIGKANLISNPGCYPTAAQLPLIPLLEKQLIEHQNIIIDAKSGITGAGRSLKMNTLFCEVVDGLHAYNISLHRHTPEIEQGLSKAIGNSEDIFISFTPHLIPMARGILETIYVQLKNDSTIDDLHNCLSKQYENEPFVHVLPRDSNPPQTRHVRGSNHCVMAVFGDRIPGRAIITSVIDNLVKGASGQAIQNMNLVMGFPETMGLEASPVFP